MRETARGKAGSEENSNSGSAVSLRKAHCLKSVEEGA